MLIAIALVFMVSSSGARPATRTPCDDSLSVRIPPRAPNALGGRAFVKALHGLTDDEKELYIRRELMAGNIPNFLRHLVPIRLPPPSDDSSAMDVVVCAAPDYLAIGSDEDFMLTPMRLATALATASDFGFTLPTPRIVDAIYEQATAHFTPQPLPASSEMRGTEYSVRHNALVGAQRMALGVRLGSLIAGDKKDLVLTNRLRTHLDRVAIYGWHSLNGNPIQSLSTVHGWRYADYSHGARLISTQLFIDGQPRSIFSALEDSRLARALSYEGIIANVTGLIETLDGRAHAAAQAAIAAGR
jgi:hypothetical protein